MSKAPEEGLTWKGILQKYIYALFAHFSRPQFLLNPVRNRRNSMNKFDLEFLNGYIKTSLRTARKIKNASTLEEAHQIAARMEEKALEKLEETMRDL